jgi:outer membrane protein assembly factor BamB
MKWSIESCSCALANGFRQGVERMSSRQSELRSSYLNLAVRLAFAWSVVVACGPDGQPEAAGEPAASTNEALATPYNWLQYGGDARHADDNTLETQITASNVGTLTKLFQASLPNTADSSPAVLTNVSTSSGTRDLVFVTTKSGNLVALDAHSGATIWSVQHGGNSPTMASCAVDPSLNFVYTYGLEGSIHKHAVGTGAETTGGGWPELATTKPSVEKGGGSFTIANSGGTNYLYVVNGGYFGDGGDYQGHITTINLATGAQSVFNANCSDQTVHFTTTSPDCAQKQSAVWAREGVMYDSDTGKIYFTTGNGAFNPGGFDWGDTLMALNPNGTGVNGGPVDSYTPTNFQTLQSSDLDFGSSGPVVLPATSKYPHLAVHCGKDQTIRIVNLDNLSGQGGPGHTGGEIYSRSLPQGGENQNSVAVWTSPADGSTWVFIVSPSNGIAGLKLAVDGSGNPSLTAVWQIGGGGGSPMVGNSVLYYAKGSTLYALNPETGSQLWSGALSGGTIHWQQPVVANGIVYIADGNGKIDAFSLPGGGQDAGVRDAGGQDATCTSGCAVQINSGGPAGSPFVADEDFAGGSTINHANTIDLSGVTNPAPMTVYQTARIGNFAYTVPGFVAGTSHTVRLHFAETYFSTKGSRVFNTSINGTQVLSDFDIFATAGAKNKAVIEQFSESANSSGDYVITFTSVVNNSLVSGIEIH